jgi:hypothetical protein
LLYLNGISDIKTRSRGRGFDFGETAGAFNFRSLGRGTFQTRLSKLAAPPRKLPYRHVILWWALGLAIIYWLFGELVWIHQLSAVRSATLFPQYAHAYSGLALLILTFARVVQPPGPPPALATLGVLVYVRSLRAHLSTLGRAGGSLISLATTQTHLDGYHITAYKGIAQGERYLALLCDAEALGANAVLNTCFDDALDVETLYHGAAVVIQPVEAP